MRLVKYAAGSVRFEEFLDTYLEVRLLGSYPMMGAGLGCPRQPFAFLFKVDDPGELRHIELQAAHLRGMQAQVGPKPHTLNGQALDLLGNTLQRRCRGKFNRLKQAVLERLQHIYVASAASCSSRGRLGEILDKRLIWHNGRHCTRSGIALPEFPDRRRYRVPPGAIEPGAWLEWIIALGHWSGDNYVQVSGKVNYAALDGQRWQSSVEGALMVGHGYNAPSLLLQLERSAREVATEIEVRRGQGFIVPVVAERMALERLADIEALRNTAALLTPASDRILML